MKIAYDIYDYSLGAQRMKFKLREYSRETAMAWIANQLTNPTLAEYIIVEVFYKPD